MSHTDDPNTAVTVVVGVVSAILLFVLVVVLQALFFHAERLEKARKATAVAPEELTALRSSQQELLHAYRWIDQANGVVGIPIERAMELQAAQSTQR